MKRTLITCFILMSVLIISSIPASAIILEATLSADCESYTVTVTGRAWYPYTADFSLSLSGNGDPITIEGSFDIIPDGDDNVNTSHTGNWDDLLCGTYIVSGSFELSSDRSVPPYNYPIISGDFEPISLECECDSSPGTGTPGYWKNHPEAWPVEEITICSETYSKTEAISIIKMSVKKDKTYTMFNALVAAMLNVLIGNESWCIAETIDAAEAWMCSYGPVGSGVEAGGEDSPWRDGESLYEELDDYNNGLLCAPARD